MNSPLTSKAQAIQWQVDGKTKLAETAYRQMIASDIRDRDIFNNLGIICLESAREEQAALLFRSAIDVDPHFAEAHSGLGSALCRKSPEQAEAQFRLAITLQPDFFHAKYNMGNLLWKVGRIEEAIASYRDAIRDCPAYVLARYNMSMALLLTGNLREGFAEYEYRLQRKGYRNAIHLPWDKPLWDGKIDSQYKVVMIPEPGFGDIFHFIRYGRTLRKHGLHMVLQAQNPLRSLLDSSGCYDEFIPRDASLDASTHRWCPMFSLPHLMGTTLDNIPADIPYLFAEPERVARWKNLLPKGKRLVGINWQGNPHHEKTMNEGRSIPLEHFAALADMEDVCLVSLQKFHGLDQLENCAFRDRILVFDEATYPSEPAFLEAAALIQALDLVVTSDTSIAHLAGALGAKVWVALMHIPEWRWLLGRSDTAWYPTMKLYRQPAPGDWRTVFQKIRNDIYQLD